MHLPENLRSGFWDLRFDELDTERDRDLIVARIAEYGTDASVRWLLDAYGPEGIAAGLEARRNAIGTRTRNLWRIWLGKGEDWCRTPSRPLKGHFWKP